MLCSVAMLQFVGQIWQPVFMLFAHNYYLWHSDWLKLFGWLAARSPLLPMTGWNCLGYWQPRALCCLWLAKIVGVICSQKLSCLWSAVIVWVIGTMAAKSCLLPMIGWNWFGWLAAKSPLLPITQLWPLPKILLQLQVRWKNQLPSWVLPST